MYTVISGIYKITCTPTGKFYIGSAVSIKERWKNHRLDCRHNKNRSKHLQNAWNKYGEAAFEFAILEVVPNIKDLISREQYYIDLHWSSGMLLNIARMAGSTLGLKMTEEQRLKMIARSKGKPNLKNRGRSPSAETRAKMSVASKANPSRFWLGKRQSAEHVEKVRNALKGRLFSDEWRQKISAAKKGQKAWLGKKHSPETIEKMRKARTAWHQRNIIQTTL